MYIPTTEKKKKKKKKKKNRGSVILLWRASMIRKTIVTLPTTFPDRLSDGFDRPKGCVGGNNCVYRFISLNGTKGWLFDWERPRDKYCWPDPKNATLSTFAQARSGWVIATACHDLYPCATFFCVVCGYSIVWCVAMPVEHQSVTIIWNPIIRLVNIYVGRGSYTFSIHHLSGQEEW